MSSKTARKSVSLEQRIENIIHDKFAHMLADVDFRIQQAYAVAGRAGGGGERGGKVYAEDLNLIGRHMLTGYTTTANSPGAGSIAWANVHVVYNGVDTVVTDGNTALKYCWWSPTTTPTVIQTSNSKPVLAAGEVLLFVNNNGTPKVMLSDTNSSLPSQLADGSVDTGSIIANAVTSVGLADNSVQSSTLAANVVTSAKIADGAVVRATQLGGNVVTTPAIAANAVTGALLADGAVTRTTQLGANVVTSAAVAANAVTATQLADGAVTRASQMAANVVTGVQIADNSVTSTELNAGAVVASKLSILRHVLY
jgi:hypothetical protein